MFFAEKIKNKARDILKILASRKNKDLAIGIEYEVVCTYTEKLFLVSWTSLFVQGFLVANYLDNDIMLFAEAPTLENVLPLIQKCFICFAAFWLAFQQNAQRQYWLIKTSNAKKNDANSRQNDQISIDELSE